jgi:hypothetical protein
MSNAKRRHRRRRRVLVALIADCQAIIREADAIIRDTHKCPWSMQEHAAAWKVKRLALEMLR